MKKPQTASVADIFERALQDCAPQPGDTIGIALSGGLDSSALLHLAHAWAQEQGVALRAFHVHHGLSPNADAWLAHCEALCASLGVPFEASRVSIEINPKTGTEEAARKRRYAALGALCAQTRRAPAADRPPPGRPGRNRAAATAARLGHGRLVGHGWRQQRARTAGQSGSGDGAPAAAGVAQAAGSVCGKTWRSRISTTNRTTTRALPAMLCGTR